MTARGSRPTGTTILDKIIGVCTYDLFDLYKRSGKFILPFSPVSNITDTVVHGLHMYAYTPA